MTISEEKKLVYWLLFDIYQESTDVSRQKINKDFCRHFNGKTDKDIDNGMKKLVENHLVTLVNEKEQTYRISPEGSKRIVNLFERIIGDTLDNEFFMRYHNNVDANYLKRVRRLGEHVAKPDIDHKIKAALENIGEFLLYLEVMGGISEAIRKFLIF